MNGHHIILLSNFFIFLVGMILGAALAHNPLLWVLVIVLVAVALGLMGASVRTKKKRKTRVARPKIEVHN